MYRNPEELIRVPISGIAVPVPRAKSQEWRKEAELAAKKQFPLDRKNQWGEFFLSVGSIFGNAAYLVLFLEFLSLLRGSPLAGPFWKLALLSLPIGFLFAAIGNRLAGQRRASIAAHTQALYHASLKAYEAQVLAEKAAEEGFYVSEEWHRLRAGVIRRDGRVCQNPGCGTYIESDFDLTVDHIKPRSLFPELAFDPSNLQVLCRACNSSKGNQV